jgi:septal ring factor EnvC (AmiA/AmiB activator)
MKKTGFLLMLVFCLTGHIAGQTSTVKQLEAQRKAALEDIESTTLLLSETRSSAQNSLNRLNLLTKQVQARRKVISLLNQEIGLMDKSIAEMNNELNSLKQELVVIRNKYAKSVQLQARQSAQYKWLFILSADDFAQSIRRMRYLREYAGWQKHQASLIVKKQDEINQKQLEMERKRTGKLALLNEREIENHKLETEESEQKNEFQALDKKQQDLQKKLTQKRKQAEALNRQIEALISNETAHSDAASDSRKAETAGGYAMTKEEQKLSDDFASNRGRLPFPMVGNYKIVGQFGEHQHPEWKHVRVYNKGIDIQTTSGTEARAVFNGEVTSIFVVPGYNPGVIVRHGNYRTVYVNLSEVYVKTGDKVSTGQKLGKIFTDTQNDNVTVLHFEIRKEKTELNPELWLN